MLSNGIQDGRQDIKPVINLGTDDFVINVEAATIQNSYYRKVLYTSGYMQFVVMSILPQTEIGMEIHTGDQFIRIDSGEALVEINGREYEVGDGSGFIVPSGSSHNVTNTSNTELLQLYSIYSPPQHEADTIEPVKVD